MPAKAQYCDNVVVRLERRTTNIQRCNDVNVTKLKLQRCSSNASTLGSKFNSLYTISFILKTLMQR